VGAAALSSGLSSGCAVVVVDVLSFTTSTTVAVERGIAVFPHAWHDSAAEYARSVDARVAVGRRRVDPDHPWSLSPAALLRAPHTPRLVLPSPNGSTIAAAASGLVVAACLRNATAVGRWVSGQGYGTPSRPVLVVPAGERWPDGSLRPSLEDALGAGAVISALASTMDPSARPPSPAADPALSLAPASPSPSPSPSPSLSTSLSSWPSLSPEAAWLRAAYLGTPDVAAAVRESASGRELIRSGFAEDVDIAVELDASTVVPVLTDGAFRPAPS
jgi:2-phosphosulfolactate phosphatase